jgi:hypothetical protein
MHLRKWSIISDQMSTSYFALLWHEQKVSEKKVNIQVANIIW